MFPVTARISQKSILEQEKALAELDAAIDDWGAKLEQAENQRSRVSEKLLQHIAAVLSLPTLDSHSSDDLNIPTPPVSPERLQTPEGALRKDVESIKIYADSDMYALLADIEQEICANENPDKSISPGIDPGAPVALAHWPQVS